MSGSLPRLTMRDLGPWLQGAHGSHRHSRADVVPHGKWTGMPRHLLTRGPGSRAVTQQEEMDVTAELAHAWVFSRWDRRL